MSQDNLSQDAVQNATLVTVTMFGVKLSSYGNAVTIDFAEIPRIIKQLQSAAALDPSKKFDTAPLFREQTRARGE